MIKGIIFDMDGLLIDSEPLWKEAEIEVFSTVGIDLTAKGCEETVGLRIDEVVDLWYERQPWENKSKNQVVREIIACMEQLILEKGEPKKGVTQIFDYFEKKQLPKAIATSSHTQLLETVIRKFGLKDHLHHSHSAEHETFGKPHPGVFMTSARKLKLHPHQCLVFEDSLNGVIAAKAAKMKVVAVPEKSHSFNDKLVLADLIIEDLSQFNDTHFELMNQQPQLQFHPPFEPK